MMRRSPWAAGSTCTRRRAGLHVTGRLDRNVQRARELFSLLETQGLDGLSIGFRTVRARRDRASASRLLTEIDLWEISLVTFPMLAGRGSRREAFKSERVSAMETGLETKVAFGDMMQAFEAFKEANDERLAQIETRMGADVVTDREGGAHQPRGRRGQGAGSTS